MKTYGHETKSHRWSYRQNGKEVEPRTKAKSRRLNKTIGWKILIEDFEDALKQITETRFEDEL